MELCILKFFENIIPFILQNVQKTGNLSWKHFRKKEIWMNCRKSTLLRYGISQPFIKFSKVNIPPYRGSSSNALLFSTWGFFDCPRPSMWPNEAHTHTHSCIVSYSDWRVLQGRWPTRSPSPMKTSFFFSYALPDKWSYYFRY